MLFSFSDLSPLFFPSFSDTPLSPQWGSPPDAGQEVGLLASSGPPPPLSPAPLVYIPLPLFGDLKAPPSSLCRVQTLSPSRRRKAGPTYSNSLDFYSPTCCLHAMPALSLLQCRVISSSSFSLANSAILSRAYLEGSEKVRSFTG